MPCPTGADIRKLLTNREVFQNCKQKYTGVVPSNLFILSDEEDCLLAMKWVKDKLVGIPGKIFVLTTALSGKERWGRGWYIFSIVSPFLAYNYGLINAHKMFYLPGFVL